MGVGLDGTDVERCKETNDVVLGNELFRDVKRFLVTEVGLAISASATSRERETFKKWTHILLKIIAPADIKSSPL